MKFVTTERHDKVMEKISEVKEAIQRAEASMLELDQADKEQLEDAADQAAQSFLKRQFAPALPDTRHESKRGLVAAVRGLQRQLEKLEGEALEALKVDLTEAARPIADEIAGQAKRLEAAKVTIKEAGDRIRYLKGRSDIIRSTWDHHKLPTPRPPAGTIPYGLLSD